MNALSLALVLAAAPVPEAPAAPVPAVAPVPVSAPAPVTPARPTMLAEDPPQASPAVAVPAKGVPASTSTLTPTSSPTPTTAKPAVTPVSQATVEKLGQGDRAFLAGEYRNALFAYQDAVYLAPRSAVARVRLGRAYLALRYPAQAVAQAEQALAVDPENADARLLISEANGVTARPIAPAAGAAAAAGAPRSGGNAAGANGAPPGSGARAATTAPAPRVYAFTPEPDATPTPPSTAGSSVIPVAATATAAEGGAPDGPGAAAARPERAAATSEFAAVRVEGAPDPAGPGPSASGATAPQRYRTALELLANREFEKAVSELTQAILLDPRLAVAYAARGSARFGLGRYREAADDYQTSVSLDDNLGTPLYGLAECHRVLGDGRRASELYQRYADSRAPDVREDLRAISARRAQELR